MNGLYDLIKLMIEFINDLFTVCRLIFLRRGMYIMNYGSNGGGSTVYENMDEGGGRLIQLK